LLAIWAAPALLVSFVVLRLVLTLTLRSAAWYGNAPLVSSTVAFPIAFYLSDAIGRKPLMQFGAVSLFVGSCIAAPARTPAQIIVGLVLMGFGVGFLATCLVGISDVVSVRQRGMFLGKSRACQLGLADEPPVGILDIGGGLSVLSASMVGGALTSNTPGSWRNCFWLAAALSGGVCKRKGDAEAS
jgi:MFS family permease